MDCIRLYSYLIKWPLSVESPVNLSCMLLECQSNSEEQHREHASAVWKRHKDHKSSYIQYMPLHFCYLNTVFSGPLCMTIVWSWHDVQCSCPSASEILELAALLSAPASPLSWEPRSSHMYAGCVFTPLILNMQTFLSFTVCRSCLSRKQHTKSRWGGENVFPQKEKTSNSATWDEQRHIAHRVILDSPVDKG